MSERRVEVRLLRPGDEAVVTAFLAAHADASLFLRRNLLSTGLEDRAARYHGTWAGAFERERLVAVAQHTRFSSVVVQAPVHTGAVTERAVRESGRPVGGVIGPWAQTIAARAALGLDAVPMRLESREGLYALSLDALVVPAALASGAVRCRRSREDDLPTLARWRTDYRVEANAEAPSATLDASSREDVELGITEGSGFVLEASGALVAYQQFNAMVDDVVQVGGVWTPPSLRSRGYGRAVVAGALLAAKADGAQRSVLFTGDANQPARRAYHALGFDRVGDWGLLFFDRPQRPFGGADE